MAGETPARRAAVIVVGGSTMDVVATPAREHALRRGSSVPGTVQQVPGGVGRNIAEAAARIMDSSPSSSCRSATVALVSVVGADAAGRALLESCAALPLDCSGVATAPGGARTPTVVAVLDPGDGELAACVADATATEAHLPPEAVAREVSRRLAVAAAASSSSSSSSAPASVVVLDGNLSPEALLAGALAVAAASASAPALAATTAAGPAAPSSSSSPSSLFEPVSAVKAARGAAALPWLSYASPNAGELRALACAISAGRELRRRQRGAAGPLPRPSSPAAAARERWLVRARRRSGESPPPTPPPGAVMQQLRQALPDVLEVLKEGLGCLILTLGELGAVLLTLHPAAAAAAVEPRSGDGGGDLAADADPSSSSSSSSSPAVVLARHVPAVPGVRPVSTSGAGDCLVAGFAVALSTAASSAADAGADAEVAALAIGAAAAAAAVASPSNVPAEDGALDLGRRLKPLARGLARCVGVAVLPVGDGGGGRPQSRL